MAESRPCCPVPGCERRRSSTVLMCRPHWSMVRGKDGGALARRVYETFETWNDDRRNLEALADYRGAREEAIAKAASRQRELDAERAGDRR